MSIQRLIIVGGVAGGASAAARARRLSEEMEILLFERGPYVSFANCGLPYYVGGEIAHSRDLLLQTPEEMSRQLHIDVRVHTEVTHIDRVAKVVTARNLQTGEVSQEPYDALLLAPGATPVKPPLPGIDRPGLFTLRNVPDAQALSNWITTHRAQRAVVVGGGYIGLELTEQLVRRGLEVAVVEASSQVMGILDPEMAAHLHHALVSHGVSLALDTSVLRFEEPAPEETAAASTVVLSSGKRLPADVIVLGVGVRPEVSLARDAGLEIGANGGIRVSESLQTSDPHIWAVGDAIEVRNTITGEWTLIPLAGPANRQGRIAADSILGRNVRYSGTQGTGILRLFDVTAACTGLSERAAQRAGTPHYVVHLHPHSHARYYPGGAPMTLKLVFAPDGRILGGQAIGGEGVDKRIDILATAIHGGMRVEDLAELELAYAPPFGSAKDPINITGMMAQNVLNGDVAVIQWHEIASRDPDKTLLLDVRQPSEWDEGGLPNAIRIPLPELRARIAELPPDREIWLYCRSGQRAYYAARILSQHGFRCRNLTGAFLTWQMGVTRGLLPSPLQQTGASSPKTHIESMVA